MNASRTKKLTSLEVCAGAGGQALGLEQAGFEHVALIEIDPWACETLRRNRPGWNTLQLDLREFCARKYRGIDLLSAGVPCPPFSVAGKQLGSTDERDLFPEVLRLARECEPRAVLVENVRGLLDPRFGGYRAKLGTAFSALGFKVRWAMLNASDFGVPQLRPRVLMVALRTRYARAYLWPAMSLQAPPTVGEVLYEEMASRGWKGAAEWQERANAIAPTLVGGSAKHGGPDLGPTRARKAWAKLGVDGLTLAEEPPDPNFAGLPRLTVKMCAILQGFPKEWEFAGRKTAAYRQVGNAFPPPVARAVGLAVRSALNSLTKARRR